MYVKVSSLFRNPTDGGIEEIPDRNYTSMKQDEFVNFVRMVVRHGRDTDPRGNSSRSHKGLPSLVTGGVKDWIGNSE